MVLCVIVAILKEELVPRFDVWEELLLAKDVDERERS